MMRRLREFWRREDGMTTAEYAVGLIAAVAFAGILYKVVTSGTVMTALTSIVKRALSQG
jgi:Flp pilus assembly pilin Flp